MSSAHAIGFQEAKHDRDETFGGEHRLMLRKFKSHWLIGASRICWKIRHSSSQQRLEKHSLWSLNLMRWGVVWWPVNSLTDIWFQKLSESSRTGVPTKLEYTATTGEEVLTLLQSAAGVMPVPLLQDAIRVALKVIQLCEVGWIPPWKVARQLMKMFSSGRIGCWTKGQRAARKGRPSHDRYLTPCNTQEWRWERGGSCNDYEEYRRGYQGTCQVRPMNYGLRLLLMI